MTEDAIRQLQKSVSLVERENKRLRRELASRDSTIVQLNRRMQSLITKPTSTAFKPTSVPPPKKTSTPTVRAPTSTSTPVPPKPPSS